MSQPLILRLLAASVNVTNRAGILIRDILAKGDLGIVEKVSVKGRDLKSIGICA